MRELPPRAVALRTRGSQFDFALNSRRTVENAADRARFSCSLCPQPLRSERRERLKCLEMLRLKTPSSRSKSPRTRNEPPKPRSGTPKTGSKSPNSRAAHAIKCYGSSEIRTKPERTQESPEHTQRTRGYSFPSIGQGHAERRTGALRGAALRA